MQISTRHRYRMDCGEPSEWLHDLFRLHESRWATKGGPGSMRDCPATQSFLIEATRQFSALGKLRLYTMSFRGELTAGELRHPGSRADVGVYYRYVPK